MLSVEEVLRHYKMEIQKSFGSEIRCLCPFHNDTNPSLDINAEGLWLCRSCGEHGNLIQFVAKLEHVDYKTAELLLNNNFSLIIDDDLAYIMQQVAQIEARNNEVEDNAATPDAVKSFVLGILKSISELPPHPVLQDWMKVLVFVRSDTERRSIEDYYSLYIEFKNDVQSIRGRKS